MIEFSVMLMVELSLGWRAQVHNHLYAIRFDWLLKLCCLTNIILVSRTYFPPNFHNISLLDQRKYILKRKSRITRSAEIEKINLLYLFIRRKCFLSRVSSTYLLTTKANALQWTLMHLAPLYFLYLHVMALDIIKLSWIALNGP